MLFCSKVILSQEKITTTDSDKFMHRNGCVMNRRKVSTKVVRTPANSAYDHRSQTTTSMRCDQSMKRVNGFGE